VVGHVANPLVSKVELSNTLRQMRVSAGKTLDEAARALEVSVATVSRIETGVRIPRARDVRELCHLYGVAGSEAERVVALVQGARGSGWWDGIDEIDEKYATYIAYEEAASGIDHFETSAVPALLQTEEFGREYLRSTMELHGLVPPTDDQISRRIELRNRRRKNLMARDDITFRLVLDETCLESPPDDPDILDRQLRAVLDFMSWSRAEIRILPKAPARGRVLGTVSSFTCLRLPQARVSDLVYIDNLQGQFFMEDESDVLRHEKFFLFFLNRSLDSTASRRLIESKIGRHG